MVLDGESVRKIHKRLFDMTINNKKMFAYMVKVANKSKKIVNPREKTEVNADLLMFFLLRNHYNDGIKKIINHDLMEKAENSKQELIESYINTSRDAEKWIYLASSHSDCAKDHLPYQGRLYFDEKAPESIVRYCKNKGMHSIQWVMDAPAWFITRPNCRHFFKSLPTDVVKQYGLHELQRLYKTHRMVGDRELATPKKVAIEEYEDRLKMLRAMYQEHPTEKLRREILKTEMLIKKWKNEL